MAGVLAIGSQLTGQVTDGTVIYNSCRYLEQFKTKPQFGPHESCGINEAANRLAQETRERTEELRRQIEAERRTLTESEEQQITNHLEQKFLGNKMSQWKEELDQLLQTTATRLEGLLGTPSYKFTESEAEQLRAASVLVATLSATYDHANISKLDMRHVRDQLAPLLTGLHVMLTEKQRATSSEGPKVENLVTRIDNLVARVGTVIRDLERSGQPVPMKVQQGYRRASQLVRETKRTCSTNRPAACSQLAQVLDEIDAMREPLCKIDSPLLSFCQ